jgi:hypothetical protein
MMAATCFDILSKDIKGITPNEVDDLLKELQARQRKLVNEGVAVDEANQRASKSVQDDLKMAAAIERRSAAINLRVRLQQLDMIRTSFPDDVVQGLEAMMVGSKYSAENSRYGVDQIQESLKRKYVGGLVGDLQRAELLDVFASGTHDLDIARALRDLDTKSITDKLPREAVAMAVIVRRWQEASRLDANRAGAWVGKLPDYILTQSHDQDRILNAGFDKWYRAIVPRLDIARMFPGASGPPDVRAFLRATYDGLVTGIHENLGGAEKMAGFKGPGNLAKKQSQERKLHFKSADDWFEYNKDFGGGNLRESVVMGLSKLADATGLMRGLGTNPEANLATIVDTLRQEMKDAGRFDELKKLDEWARGRGEGLYSIIAGRHRAAVNATGALVGTTVRGMQNITALGGAVLASISDPFVAANSATHEGRNLLGAFANQILAPVNAAMDKVSGGQRAAALRELNYFGDGITGGIGARFSMTEGVPGVMSKLQRWAFGLNLLRPWTDVGRGAALLGTSGHLAELTKLDFSNIGDDATRMLARYGLTEKHWPLLREAVRDFDRYTVMTPEALRTMDVRKFADLASARVDDVKSGMVGRIQKRMQQDARERDWVRIRAEKLRDGIQQATEKLAERISRAEGKAADGLRAVNDRLASLYSDIETASEYWDSAAASRRQALEGAYQSGKTEAYARNRRAELNRRYRKVVSTLEGMKESLDKEFVSKWLTKESNLMRDLESVEDGSGKFRMQRFQDMFAEANASLTARVGRADDVADKRIAELLSRLQNEQEELVRADSLWSEAVARQPKNGDLRHVGVSEGKARELGKSLRAEVRQITRELDRLKKEFNEDFVSRWQEKEGQFLAFAEGVDERIKARAEKTEQELVDLDPAIKRILEDQREDVATRLESLLYDRMNYSVISPTARTEYLQTAGGQQRGTIPGELSRLVMQFKSFPIAFWQNAIQQELYGKGAKSMKQVGGMEIIGLARLMAMTTVAGYLSMTAKDWAKGKSARPTNSVHTWMAAAVQGGGMGIYGDFILGEANRFGQSAVETLAGPTLGDVADVVELLQSARDGDDPSAKAVRLLVNNTPFMNLFYVRMAMDHMFLYELQEQLNPGYLRRMEKRVERETGAKWMIRPSEAIQ